jgi:predicted DNA-binding transcriptional regulator AlpA
MIQYARAASRSPFTSVWQAASLLGAAGPDVYHLIQDGSLPLAFNIARPGGARACVRVATAAVLALKRGKFPPSGLQPFLASLLPDSRFSYSVPQLAFMLQCDPDHIYHLIAHKQFEDVGGPTRYRVPRRSIAGFLTSRQLS